MQILKKIISPILAILLMAASCTPELADSPEMIVVEGWIESGSAPVVFITSSVSVNYDRKKMNDLISHVALNANVTVTHNDQTYTLLPSLKDEYLLKLCYTTDDLKGEPGGIYQLHVDWKGRYAEAVTTIPQPGSIETQLRRYPVSGQGTCGTPSRCQILSLFQYGHRA